MCRYAGHGWPYRMPYACFNCRISLKQDLMYYMDTESEPRSFVKCPNCESEMKMMGHDFQAPRKSNKNQWRKIRLLYEAGITFNSCGCEGPGYRPKTLSEAKNSVKIRTEEEIFKKDLKFGRSGFNYDRKRYPIGAV